MTDSDLVPANKRVVIVALTEPGKLLAERLLKCVENSELWFKPKPFAEKVQGAFSASHRLILICATGIAVRTLAPVLASKISDPAVLVLDEQGQFVIPLLSGHEGGANAWAYDIAQALSAQLVLTTANSYLQPVYALGMGCERGCPAQELEQLLRHCLELADLSLADIDSINSIDIKADEVGLIALGKTLQKPLQTFDSETLMEVEGLLNSKSDYVFSVVGVYGVAESAALVAAKMSAAEMNATKKIAARKSAVINPMNSASAIIAHQPELVLVKQKTKRATCAIARCYLVN